MNAMPDLWAERDLPVLQSIVRRVIADDYAASQDVVRDTGLPDHIVDRSVRQLRDAGYVNAHFEGGGGFGVMSVNPIALTTTGAWPTPESWSTGSWTRSSRASPPRRVRPSRPVGSGR